MTVPTNVQTIMQDGKPVFVVLPYSEYLRAFPAERPWVPDDGIPHDVMKIVLRQNLTLARAWREYLGLTQEEVATRMKVSQSALAQMENAKRPRRATLQKLAVALNILPEQLGV